MRHISNKFEYQLKKINIMRKILFSVAALFAFGAANAQDAGGFSLGAHVGAPMGDAKDAVSVNFGVDAAYMFPVAENFTLGIASGYTMFSGKNRDNITIVIPGQPTYWLYSTSCICKIPYYRKLLLRS